MMFSQPATANVPTPLWRDVARLNIVCLVMTERGVDTGALHRRICDRASAVAGVGSPVPVEVHQIGDRQILASDSVALMVHATARPDDGGRLLALSIRPYRNDGSTQDMLFAAAPRAVRLGDADDGLDAALSDALDETLPWREPGDRALPPGGQADIQDQRQGVK